LFLNHRHVCYAPELETVDDTRQKLEARQREIAQRLNPNVFRIGKPNNPTATNSAVEDPTIPDEVPPDNPQTSNEPEEKSESISLTPQSSEIIIPPKPQIVKRIVYHQPSKKRRLSGRSYFISSISFIYFNHCRYNSFQQTHGNIEETNMDV